MAGRKIRDENDARTCLHQAATSGLSPGAWASAHGVDGRSLNAWRLNLTARNPPAVREPLDFVELLPNARARPGAAIQLRHGAWVVVLRVVAAC